MRGTGILDRPTSCEAARRVRNRAALATLSTGVVTLTAFGYLPQAAGLGAFLTIVALAFSFFAFLVLAGVTANAALDVQDFRYREREDARPHDHGVRDVGIR